MNTSDTSKDTAASAAFPCVIVVPVFNESATLRRVIDEWMPMLHETLASFAVLIVDDGSSDSTPDVCAGLAREYPEVHVIRQANAGHGRACLRGYREAIKLHAEWVFQIDSDGQCDPQFFPALWAAREGAIAVYGVRVRREDGKGRELISTFCRIAVRLTSGTKVPDANVPYRLLRASLLETAVENFPQMHLSNVLVSVLFYAADSAAVHQVPIVFRDRIGGEPAVKWSGFVRRGWELINDLKRTRDWARDRAALMAAQWKAGKTA